jgi:hypothetical protein
VETIEFLKEENRRLRECIGSWRRLAQEKAPRRACVKEGYSSDFGGYHYKVFKVTDIPVDLPIEDVLKEVSRSFLPTVFPYQFRRIDYSKNHGWLVEVQKGLRIDMNLNI